MIGDLHGQCVPCVRRWVEPNPQLGGLVRAEETHRPAARFAHRVHHQLREEAEARPVDAAASGGQSDGGRPRKPESLRDRGFDPIGAELERVALRRFRGRSVVRVLGAPELGDDLHLFALATTAQDRDLLVVSRIHHEHQILPALPLDVRIEEPVRVAVQEGLHQRGLHDSTAVHQPVDDVAEDAGTLVRGGARAEGELPLELGEGGVGEDEGGRRDPCIHNGIFEQALQLQPFDGERWRDRDGAPSHEHRADRAARDRRRQEEVAVLEVEHDGVASQREIPNGRDPLELLHVAQTVEHRLVAL